MKKKNKSMSVVEIIVSIVGMIVLVFAFGCFMAYFRCHGNPDYPFKSPFQITCEGARQ